MQSEPGVIAALAVLDRDIVTNLPTDPVAAVVASDYLAEDDVGTVLEEDAPGGVAVQFFVVCPVPVQGEILDYDVGQELATEDREQGRGGRVACRPQVLAQSLVELEAVAGSSD